MSVADENKKTFIITHVFKDVKHQLMKREVGTEMAGPVELHHGVEWKLRLVKSKASGTKFIDFHLDCVKPKQSGAWSIETEFDEYSNGKKIGVTKELTFTERSRSNDDQSYISYSRYEKFSVNHEMAVEFRVTIKKMTGVKMNKHRRNFDDDSTKEHSDVVLKIGNQQFHVLKHFLAMHSPYFESMFFGSFAESKKPEIELNDIDPVHFQHFLELIHGESLVTDRTVEGILQLADFFGAKTAIKRCRQFLLKKSHLPLKRKFDAAIRGGFDDVKKKCLDNMQTKEDVRSVLPEDPAFLHPTIWAELLEKMYILK